MAQFEALDATFNNGEGYSTFTNEKGSLAWGEAYVLDAYLDMYEATRDRRYLERFVRHADRVSANTDVKQGRKDYGGRSLAGWGSTKYGYHEEPIVWAVHTGMITYPLVRFASLAGTVKGFSKPAKRYVALAKEAAAVFDGNWVYDPSSRTGHYRFDSDEPHKHKGLPLPFNQQLALGRTLVLLAAITGEPAYRTKAEGLATHFRKHLVPTADGGFRWNYWYREGLRSVGRAEDISHGAIDVDFAVLCRRHGIVFTDADMNRFAMTLGRTVLRNGRPSALVDGSGPDKYWDAVGRWLELIPYDPGLGKAYMKLLRQKQEKPHPRLLLGTAKLIKYFDRIQPLKGRSS